MISIFQDIVKKNYDKTALKFGRLSFTYGELDRISDCIAQLILQSGHTPSKIPYIGIYSSRTQYTIPMMIGIWKAGFTYVPMDPKYSSERIKYIIDDCNLKLVITDCDAPVSDYPQAQWLTINEAALSAVAHRPVHEEHGRYAYVIYTSGTTGKPKGIPISHVGLSNLIEVRKKTLYTHVENTLETCIASIAFDYSVWEMFCPLMTGTAVYFFSEEEKANPQRIAEILEEQHVTTFSITPTYLSIIPYRPLPDLKYLVFGGEACPEPLVRKWQNTSTLVNAYGPTEATVFITANILGKEDAANDIGLPMEGTTCYILDEQHRQVPLGEKGELYIGGIQVTDGYLNKEELNRQKFIPNPFVGEGAIDPILYASGDIAYQLPNGHFICCGRKDSQVKLHGFRIELDEIKTAIEQCSQVEAAAVEVAQQGEQKYLRAFAKAKTSPLDIDQLKKELKGVLPPYMIPTRIIEVSDIPKNINGKIDFKALAAILPSEQQEDEVSGEVEEQIAAIWHDLLGNMESIKSDSNFIEVGGDSISIIFMMQRINQQFNTQLTIDDIYRNLTLNQLASLIPSHSSLTPLSLPSHSPNKTPLTPLIKPLSLPLPQHLQNVYVHCMLNQQASLAYNLVELIPFEPSLKKNKLLEVWNKLLEMHDAFRMTFYTDAVGKHFMKANDFEPQTTIPEFTVADDDEVKALITERLSRPYDLEHGPLYFAELYHYKNGKWLFAVYIHHLISDGWSLDEVGQQMYALYAQKDLGAADSFANYVYDTYKKEEGTQGVDSKKYWDTYQDDVPELKLPGIIEENDSDDYTTGCVLKQLDHSLSDAIYKYCSQHQVTLFSFLSSALMLVLYRVSRQQKFMIGYASSGRTTAESLNMLGYFVHPCPMKFEESLLDMSFDQLCKHTIEDIREATAHGYAVPKLPPVNFTLEDMRHETRMGINLPYQLAPLMLTVDADEKKLQCRWLYRRTLAETEQIDLLSRCYIGLVQQIVEAGSQPVRTLSMIDRSAYENMVKQNTITPLSLPSETIVDVFQKQVERYPDHLALKDERHSYTYQELDKASKNVASVLLSDGLPQGAVGIYCERSSQSLATIMGIVRAGCFYVPINDSYPKERLRHIITDSGMQRLVTTRSLQKDVEGLVPSVRIYFMEDMLETQANIKSQPEITTSTPAYMIYTSGTTGQPKGVIVPHSSVVSMVTIGAPGVYCPTADDSVIQFSTYIFDASVIDIFCTLLTGATLVTAPEAMKKDAEQLFQFMDKEQITWACIPPAFLHSCHKDPTASLKTILVGGESPSQEIISRYRNIRFINGYGPTESTVCSTSHTYSQDATQDSNCIGKPLPGVTCYVLDDDHNLLPDGVTGELYLGGLQLATGYHNRPELNSKSFIDNPFVSQADLEQGINTRLYATGDLVCRKSDGLLYFMGRKDFQVKVRGYRIELADIESTLQTHPDVRQCLVEVRQIGDTKQLVAHIETVNNQLTGTDLRTWLADKLPAYMTPAYWSFSDHFPLTHNGKIDRMRLPEPQSCAAENADDEDTLEVERRCRFAIAGILGIKAESIDVNANLMEEIGMNSLHILEYVSQMQARGYQLHASDVYHCKTIRRLTEFMQNNKEPLTQEQIDGRVVYFSTPDNRHKPLIIFCAGTPFYETFYAKLHNVLKDDYTILVIEAACEFYSLRKDFPVEMNALIADYARILRPILKDRTMPILTVGHCIGGDMALRLAVELQNQGIATPPSINIDGTPYRSELDEEESELVIETGISEELQKFRSHVMFSLCKTFVQRHYSGPVHLIMCTKFEDEPGQTREEGLAHYAVNHANWKKAQPGMPITYVDSAHMQVINEPESLKIIKEVIDSYAFQGIR